MRLFGKKDVYEAPVAQVIDFESDYVMAAGIDSIVATTSKGMLFSEERDW